MTRDELYEYFIVENHTRKDTAQYFGITEGKLRTLLSKLGIVKPKELSSKNNTSSSISGKVKYTNGLVTKYFIEGEQEEGFTKATNFTTKESLYHDFIELNMTRKEVASKYNVTEKQVKDLLKEYSIKKDHVAANKRVHEELSKKYNSFFESVNRVNKEALEDYFIKDGHTREECCDKFDVTINNIKKILRYYGLNGENTNDSQPNRHFAYLLDKAGLTYEREFRLDKYRYDFKVGNTLIEINPSATHNTTFSAYSSCGLDKQYHMLKSKAATEAGYRCIHVFDWDNEEAIVNLLTNRPTIYGRQCVVREVTIIETREFINENHIQGYAKSKVNLGLYYNDKLVSMMTFGKPRYNKSYEYELVRYCSSNPVIGGAEKLFNHFITSYNPSSIISYCDLSKFSGEVYNKLSFTTKESPKPSLHWFNLVTGKHITDNLLRQRGFDQLFGTNYGKGVSNEELMLNHGFVKVYDCGQATYTWSKN